MTPIEHTHSRVGDNPEFRICVYHHEHISRIERTEKDVQDVWRAIDGMRRWVIMGSGSAILCLITILVQIILKFT